MERQQKANKQKKKKKENTVMKTNLACPLTRLRFY